MQIRFKLKKSKDKECFNPFKLQESILLLVLVMNCLRLLVITLNECFIENILWIVLGCFMAIFLCS